MATLLPIGAPLVDEHHPRDLDVAATATGKAFVIGSGFSWRSAPLPGWPLQLTGGGGFLAELK